MDDILLSQVNMKMVLGLYNYWVVIFLMMTGFYIVIARSNLIKTVIGLNIFQTSVFLLYITMGKVRGGTAPILSAEEVERLSRGHGDHGHGEKVAGHSGEHAGEYAGEHIDHAGDHADHAGDHADHADHVVESTSNHAEEAAHHAVESLNHAGEIIEHAMPTVYSNPLPSVLMLTAIVVGIATTALALALIVRIREDYGTIEEDEIMELDRRS